MIEDTKNTDGFNLFPSYCTLWQKSLWTKGTKQHRNEKENVLFIVGLTTAVEGWLQRCLMLNPKHKLAQHERFETHLLSNITENLFHPMILILGSGARRNKIKSPGYNLRGTFPIRGDYLPNIISFQLSLKHWAY